MFIFVPITLCIKWYSLLALPVFCLVNGPTWYEGRVEVCYNGKLGTVCNNGWDFNDSQVVCSQLGYGPPIAFRDGAYYGQGSGQIWLDNLSCTGNEVTMENCLHSRWGIQSCSHMKVSCL